MGNAGNSPLVNLDKALENGNLPHAWFAAHEARYLHLDQALSLTLLMGYDYSPHYDAAARRFLVRFIREVKPTLEQVKTVADALRAIGDEEDMIGASQARPAMADLVRQLKERRP